MPDRQRHSSLSGVFARLSAARSENSPAPAGRHRGTAPARPPQETAAAADDEGFASSGHQISTAAQSGPPWPESSRADTVELSRSAWGFSAVRDQVSDPMDDTTLLSRVPPMQASAEPAGSGSGSGSDAGDRGAPSPDPTADTTLLSRITLPQPAQEPTGPGSGSDAAALAAGAAADAGTPVKPTFSQSARSLLDRHRRRFAIGAAGVVVLGILLALPPVQAQLRDSFTRLPQPYTALYFTSPPQVDGTVLTVPVSVHAVETGSDTYSVRVWTVDAKGKVDDSQTADLKWDGQALSTVVSMPVNPQADYVWVSLNGSSQVLHYKIAVA